MIEFYGGDWCADCRRSERLLNQLGVAYDYIDTSRTAGAIDKVIAYNKGAKSIPVIVFPDGTHLTEPSDPELRAKLAELAYI
jgi:glutaredoxin